MKVAIGLPVIRSHLVTFVVVIGVKRELSDIREHRSVRLCGVRFDEAGFSCIS
jgi:hypothetical protein